MSTDRDVERIVRSWMDEGVNVLPDRVLDDVLDQIPATPQRRSSWSARRFPIMNNALRAAAVAAVVLVAVVLTIKLLPSGGTGGPTPTATATPIPTPAPTLPPSGALAPGSYRSDFLTYTVPAGWSSFQGWGANINNGDPPNGMFIAPWATIATVYSDSCHWQTTAVSIGPTVADLVDALVAQKRGATVTPTDVTIDGSSGSRSTSWCHSTSR